jgi:aspartyl-tRNA(Asn)/glutamyl-tRNA(Gln) amidotransferase subunit C
MALSEETIKKIAELARLELTPQEHTLYTKQLTAILDYVSQLEKINTEGVAPLVTATEMTQIFREDVAKPGFEPGQATSNAPEKSGNLYKVPPVL